MSRTRRGFKQTAAPTTLNGSLSDSATTVPVASGGLSSWSGIATNGPFTFTINQGKADEETCTATGISSDNITGVTRGTNNQAHASGATITHTISSVDVDEANELVAAMANNSVRVYNDANISVNNNSLTILTFNTERFDTGGLHSTSANTSRLTAVTAGKYLIFADVQWTFNASGDRMVALLLNGATTIAKDQAEPVSGSTLLTVQSLSTIYHLAANDYVEVQVYQNSGGALNAEAASNYSPVFGMAFIGF